MKRLAAAGVGVAEGVGVGVAEGTGVGVAEGVGVGVGWVLPLTLPLPHPARNSKAVQLKTRQKTKDRSLTGVHGEHLMGPIPYNSQIKTSFTRTASHPQSDAQSCWRVYFHLHQLFFVRGCFFVSRATFRCGDAISRFCSSVLTRFLPAFTPPSILLPLYSSGG